MIDLNDLESRPSDGSHLPGDQAATIERYMVDLLKALDLGHWRVWVAKDLPPEGCRLMIQPTEPRRHAMLYVAAGWWDDAGPDEKVVDLTHEALHLAHHDTDSHIRRFFEGSGDIGEYVKQIVITDFKTNLEHMVDSLSYVIAPHMPPWPAEPAEE